MYVLLVGLFRIRWGRRKVLPDSVSDAELDEPESEDDEDVKEDEDEESEFCFRPLLLDGRSIYI